MRRQSFGWLGIASTVTTATTALHFASIQQSFCRPLLALCRGGGGGATMSRPRQSKAAATAAAAQSLSASADTSSSSSAAVTKRGIFMLLSPAKTLDLSPWEQRPVSTANDTVELPALTLPSCATAKTNAIVNVLKKFTKNDFATNWKLSSSLAQSTLDYYQSFQVDQSHNANATRTAESTAADNAVIQKPCVYTYSGPAFQGLNVATCSMPALHYLQDNLCILDALYGLLRPLDQIQPYRLELNTKLAMTSPAAGSTTTATKLLDYWSTDVCDYFAAQVQARIDERKRSNGDTADTDAPVIVLNLASEEYSPLVLQHFTLPPDQCCVVHAVFREPQGRVVAVHAKRARGLMARHLADCQATTLADIQAFAAEGYQYNATDSTDTRLVFDRNSSGGGSSSVASSARGKRKAPDTRKAARKK
jgi:uncharacterized protein